MPHAPLRANARILPAERFASIVARKPRPEVFTSKRPIRSDVEIAIYLLVGSVQFFHRAKTDDHLRLRLNETYRERGGAAGALRESQEKLCGMAPPTQASLRAILVTLIDTGFFDADPQERALACAVRDLPIVATEA